MLNRINHVMCYSQRLEETADWWKKNFGYQINYLAPEAFLSMQHSEMGRMDFHHTDDDKNIGVGPMPYFIVKDIDETQSKLIENGVRVGDIEQVEESPRHSWFFDNNGNRFGIEEF